MSKKEMVWRFILHKTMQENMATLRQLDIALALDISTSTVFHALKVPRRLGAIEVRGRFFRVIHAEKLLLLWATERNLLRDIVYDAFVDATAHDIENSMPNNVIFGLFSAYRFTYRDGLLFQDAPAMYDHVYVYTNDVREIKKRFPRPAKQKRNSNLFVLQSDPWLASFGKTTPDVQTYVDLWNATEWYAKDFLDALKQKMHI